jgi:hypothetical protein
VAERGGAGEDAGAPDLRSIFESGRPGRTGDVQLGNEIEAGKEGPDDGTHLPTRLDACFSILRDGQPHTAPINIYAGRLAREGRFDYLLVESP